VHCPHADGRNRHRTASRADTGRLLVRPILDGALPGPDGVTTFRTADWNSSAEGRSSAQGTDAECHAMIEAWHRADERDVCESMAIADTAVSADLREATRRPLRPCPAASTDPTGSPNRVERVLSGWSGPCDRDVEGSWREAADVNAAAVRLQRLDPWVIVDNFHRCITVSDGELGGERAPSRLIARRGCGPAVGLPLRRTG
jgi:hypothetical protein